MNYEKENHYSIMYHSPILYKMVSSIDNQTDMTMIKLSIDNQETTATLIDNPTKFGIILNDSFKVTFQEKHFGNY